LEIDTAPRVGTFLTKNPGLMEEASKKGRVALPGMISSKSKGDQESPKSTTNPIMHTISPDPQGQGRRSPLPLPGAMSPKLPLPGEASPEDTVSFLPPPITSSPTTTTEKNGALPVVSPSSAPAVRKDDDHDPTMSKLLRSGYDPSGTVDVEAGSQMKDDYKRPSAMEVSYEFVKQGLGSLIPEEVNPWDEAKETVKSSSKEAKGLGLDDWKGSLKTWATPARHAPTPPAEQQSSGHAAAQTGKAAFTVPGECGMSATLRH